MLPEEAERLNEGLDALRKLTQQHLKEILKLEQALSRLVKAGEEIVATWCLFGKTDYEDRERFNQALEKAKEVLNADTDTTA